MNQLFWMATAWVVVLAGCAKDVDRTAKQRIFSPEDPPKVIASAAEKLPADQLSNEPRFAERVLDMGAAEATERLGAHEYGSHLKFEWATEGQPLILLDETRNLRADRGGVNGDFAASVHNSHDQGLEVIRVKGQVFARSEYGKFRQRLRDRGMAEREREEVFGALSDFNALFQKKLKLARHGSAPYEGRTVIKYVVSLGAAPSETQGSPSLPEMAASRKGVDGPTQRRLHFFNRRQPTALTGEIWVDESTSVVLRAKLNGTLAVPQKAGKEKPAQLKLSLDSSIHRIGETISLAPPKEFLPDEDKPKGIAVALERFGFGRKSGEAGKSESKEPEDEGQ